MKKHTLLFFTATTFFLVSIVFVFSPSQYPLSQNDEAQINNSNPKNEKLSRKERSIARGAYFHQMLRDPATGKIPKDIRNRELKYAEKLPKQSKLSPEKSQTIPPFEWREVGPNNVGGRTRALALDMNDNHTILAGGVDGGLWKSTDGGATWDLKSDQTLNLSVTSIAQDPSQPTTWYYCTGEYRSTTFSDQEQDNPQLSSGATGIFKSIDNGERWRFLPHKNEQQQFPNTAPATDTTNAMAFTSKIIVSPTNGSIFVATNNYGIFRSVDEGMTFSNVLQYDGNLLLNRFNDVVVDKTGNLVACMGGLREHGAGLYQSTDNGDSWNNITTDDFLNQEGEPADRYMLRAVLALAPSNSNTLYTFAQFFEKSDYRFHKIDLSTTVSEDRTHHLPSLDTQREYNMLLEVHPEDENFVIIGGINLFRSTDGFRTEAADTTRAYHIGGYTTIESATHYPNHHPDHHILCFDPENPDVVYNGHDGGLSKTDHIQEDTVTWTSLNNGYNVTQFYHASTRILGPDGELMMVGGTRDNGTPYMTTNTANLLNQVTAQQKEELSSGDGSFSGIGDTHLYVSSQRGRIRRYRYGNEAELTFSNQEIISPNYGEGTAPFITPFALDPNDEDNLYVGLKNGVLKNTNAAQTVGDNDSLATLDWSYINDLDLWTSALSVSQSPADILYVGVYNPDGKPRLARIENASTASGATEKELVDLPDGVWLNGIGIHPENADEILMVFSNYNIPSIFYSTDGGQNLVNVSGCLRGAKEIGPSIRDAKIVKIDGTTYYIVGTTIGVFATTILQANETEWVQIGDEEMGNATVSRLSFDQRHDVNVLLAATHGRGAFAGLKLQPPAIAATFNRVCDQPSAGEATIHVLITEGTPPFQVSGSYRDDNLVETAFQFIVTDEEQFIVNIEDANGATVSLSGAGLLPCTKLAVDLLDFSGEVLATTNALTWTTAAEVDNDYFTIEHSANGTHFTTVEQIKGQASRSTATSYAYTHKVQTVGTHYYRLSATDFNGQTERFNTIALTRGEGKEGLTIGKVYPNPVQSQVYVTVAGIAPETRIEAQLLGISGQVLKTFTTQTEPGNPLSFDLSAFPQGIYQLVLQTPDGQHQAVKVVK